MRNPLYLAIVLAVTGQALLFSHPMLLAYAAVLLAAFVAFVHWYEEPTLARRFGGQYEAYANRCPVGGRACHTERGDITPHEEGSTAPVSENCAKRHGADDAWVIMLRPLDLGGPRWT